MSASSTTTSSQITIEAINKDWKTHIRLGYLIFNDSRYEITAHVPQKLERPELEDDNGLLLQAQMIFQSLSKQLRKKEINFNNAFLLYQPPVSSGSADTVSFFTGCAKEPIALTNEGSEPSSLPPQLGLIDRVKELSHLIPSGVKALKTLYTGEKSPIVFTLSAEQPTTRPTPTDSLTRDEKSALADFIAYLRKKAEEEKKKSPSHPSYTLHFENFDNFQKALQKWIQLQREPSKELFSQKDEQKLQAYIEAHPETFGRPPDEDSINIKPIPLPPPSEPPPPESSSPPPADSPPPPPETTPPAAPVAQSTGSIPNPPAPGHIEEID